VLVLNSLGGKIMKWLVVFDIVIIKVMMVSFDLDLDLD
jgi:hypothetical protein